MIGYSLTCTRNFGGHKGQYVQIIDMKKNPKKTQKTKQEKTKTKTKTKNPKNTFQ